jgi:small subunit ribosomal protein S9
LVKPGTGKVFINGIPLEDYYAETYHRAEALKPLLYTGTAGKVDVEIRAAGSGAHGQSQCIAYALAQALLKANPDCEDILDGFGLLGQDRRRS